MSAPEGVEAHRTDAESQGPSRGRRWPVRVAATVAVVSAVLMVGAVFAWHQADGRADDVEERATAAERHAGEVARGIETAAGSTEDAEARAVVLAGLLRPGMADELQGVYLRLAVAACADREAPAQAVIDAVAADVSESSDTLSGHPGWETAISAERVADARAACGGTG